MGTKALRGRDNWQNEGGGKAEVAEKKFFDLLTRRFEGTDYSIRSKPRELKDIYNSVVLPQEVLEKIYNPDETWVHGIVPDYAIDNTRTKKTLYVEVKRQDGWVEGKERNAGRGNAHERSCKLFTPGLQRVLRKYGNIAENELPFWIVFQGDIARDPKRVREITFWYAEEKDHFFLWHDTADDEALFNHFETKLKRLLD
jgi:Type II restriction enzyme MunI